MNATAIKNFCTWARNTLIEQVETRMRRFSVVEANALLEDATSVDGMPLSPNDQRQRAELLELQREVGHAALAERAAYTWFNRLVAIRFMELHDYLPCRVRFAEDPSELVFDYRLPIRSNIDHILGDEENLTRIPASLMGEDNSLLLRRAFEGAVVGAARRAAANYTLAVPQSTAAGSNCCCHCA